MLWRPFVAIYIYYLAIYYLLFSYLRIYYLLFADLRFSHLLFTILGHGTQLSYPASKRNRCRHKTLIRITRFIILKFFLSL